MKATKGDAWSILVKSQRLRLLTNLFTIFPLKSLFYTIIQCKWTKILILHLRIPHLILLHCRIHFAFPPKIVNVAATHNRVPQSPQSSATSRNQPSQRPKYCWLVEDLTRLSTWAGWVCKTEGCLKISRIPHSPHLVSSHFYCRSNQKR